MKTIHQDQANKDTDATDIKSLISRYRIELAPVKTALGNQWRCSLPELPGCVEYAKDELDALRRARASAALIIDNARLHGLPWAQPGTDAPPAVNVKMRTVPDAHIRLTMVADAFRISLTEMVTRILLQELEDLRFDGTQRLDSETERAFGLGWPDQLVLETVRPIGMHLLNPWARTVPSEVFGTWVQRVPGELFRRLQQISKQSHQPVSKTASSLIEAAMVRLVERLRASDLHGKAATTPPIAGRAPTAWRPSNQADNDAAGNPPPSPRRPRTTRGGR